MLSTEKYFIKNINIGYIYFPSTKIIDCANTASLSINHDYFHLSLIDFSNNPESSPPSNKTMPITN